MSDGAVFESVRQGLFADPSAPTLSYISLYADDEGCKLWQRITELPEYYPYREERALLHTDGPSIMQGPTGDQETVVEFGAGNMSKSNILLAAGVAAGRKMIHVPIDVALDHSGEAAPEGVIRMPLLGDNLQMAPQAANLGKSAKVTYLFLGSSIGNVDAVAWLRSVRPIMRPKDRLLIGFDQQPTAEKTEAEVVAAYNDSEGVTAAFTINGLRNSFRAGRIDLAAVDDWQHSAVYVNGGIRTCCVATRDSTLRDAESGEELHAFPAGTHIHIESSQKFTPELVAEMAASSGFEVRNSWGSARYKVVELGPMAIMPPAESDA